MAPAPEQVKGETPAEHPIGDHLESERRGQDQYDPNGQKNWSNHAYGLPWSEWRTPQKERVAVGDGPCGDSLCEACRNDNARTVAI